MTLNPRILRVFCYLWIGGNLIIKEVRRIGGRIGGKIGGEKVMKMIQVAENKMAKEDSY